MHHIVKLTFDTLGFWDILFMLYWGIMVFAMTFAASSSISLMTFFFENTWNMVHFFLLILCAICIIQRFSQSSASRTVWPVVKEQVGVHLAFNRISSCQSIESYLFTSHRHIRGLGTICRRRSSDNLGRCWTRCC